jgi:hypothetical protein
MKYIPFLLAFFFSFTLHAQPEKCPQTIKVFIDCSNGGECFPSYIRQEIPIVDFVRDRQDADVHVIVTTLYNTTSSAQYSLQFAGRNGYAKFNDTLQYTVPPAANDDTKRTLFVSKIKLGLIPFLCKTMQCENISVQFIQNEEGIKKMSEKDPWNAWVFQLSANGYMNGSQNYFSGSAYFNVSADKETEKIRTNIYFSNSEQIQKYNDGTTTYKYSFLDHNVGFKHIQKLDAHWGLGIGADATNSLFSNLRYQVNATARAEYSLFPYKHFNTKRWVFVYSLGPVYNDYYDSTIYLKKHELVFQQSLGSIFSYIQPWGAANLGVFWSNYLDDFKKNNLSLNGALQFKIAKGLNFAIWGNYSFVHDQINIRKGDVDLNQLLVKNRELLSSFDYNLGVGISYRFGSKFNNTVNPAFRGMSYNISF